LNDKDYELLNSFICSRYGSCDNCPLNKYDDCDFGPTKQEIVEIARGLYDLPNNDEMFGLTHKDEEKVRKILENYRKVAIV